MTILAWIIVGLVAGIIANLIYPGQVFSLPKVN